MQSKPVKPIKVHGDYAYVTLTKGYVAVIDSADVDVVSGYNWCAHVVERTVYACRGDNSRGVRRLTYMHSVIAGTPEGKVTDHVDGNGLHNCRSNLRHATLSQNQHNQGVRKSNTSGYKGVCFHKQRQKWRASIRLNGKRKHLGLFETPEDAYSAYCLAAKERHGEYARLS